MSKVKNKKYKRKTNKGTAKRVKVTGGGKLKIAHAYKRHNLRKRTKKAKRNLTKIGYVHKSDEKNIKELLCI